MNSIIEKILNSIKNKKRSTKIRDFSLESGERQTGKTLDDIRYDHLERYNLSINLLKNRIEDVENFFGLDVFSGNGYGTYMLFKKLNCSMLGIEGSKESVAFANKYYISEKIMFSEKLFPFDLPKERFDFVTCIESIEHVKKYLQMIEQLFKCIKKNGYLFLSTPNEKHLPFSGNHNIFHHKHFTIDEIVEISTNFPNIKLLNWYGQNIYKMDAGKICGNLDKKQMEISEKKEKQILIFLFQKI